MLLRRYLILLKRVITKYFNLILIISIPLVALIISTLPEGETSSDVVSGFYIEKESESMENVSTLLLESDSGFVFEKCSSKEELENLVATGRYDCGYYFAANFEEAFITNTGNGEVTLYTSPATTFDTVTSEIVYDKLLKVFSPDIAAYYMESSLAVSDLHSDDYYSYIKEKYTDYMNSDSVFKITSNSTGTYSEAASEINMLPIRKFVAIIIYFSALFGTLAFMKDNDAGVYNRLPAKGRFGFRILNILANITLPAVSGCITLVICENAGNYLIFGCELLLYLLICLAVSLLLGYIFRHYKNLLSAMPVITICSIILAALL